MNLVENKLENKMKIVLIQEKINEIKKEVIRLDAKESQESEKKSEIINTVNQEHSINE